MTSLDMSEKEEFENKAESLSTDSNADWNSSSDDSDDEVILNRSGKVPVHWYENEEHRGYDVYGSKVTKTLMSSKIDELLKSAENPDSWRTIQDLDNEREVYLTDADLEIIRRLRQGRYPDAKIAEEDYFVEFDDTQHKIHPLRNKDLPKSRFLASKDETREITRLVKLIRAGKLKPISRRSTIKKEDAVFDMWVPTGDDEMNIF